MKGAYNKQVQFDPYTKESSDATELTVTLTPASGEVAMISKLTVSFDDDPTLPIAVVVNSAGSPIWKEYISGAAPDRLSEDFLEGLSGHVEDAVLTVVVDAAGAGIKSRVNVLADSSTTGS